jgi:hypothetical protein
MVTNSYRGVFAMNIKEPVIELLKAGFMQLFRQVLNRNISPRFLILCLVHIAHVAFSNLGYDFIICM